MLRHAVFPACLVAGLLMVIPFAETIVAVLPLRAGEVSWRFGAMGLFSRALMTPALGLTLFLLVALMYQQRALVRGVMVLSLLAALLLIAAIPIFLLDFMQMRSQVRAEALATFDVATAFALAKIVAFAVVSISFVVGSRRALRRTTLPTRSRKAPAGNVLVGS